MKRSTSIYLRLSMLGNTFLKPNTTFAIFYRRDVTESLVCWSLIKDEDVIK
ncbi:hypothetical protein ACJX0J_040593, partial [Zea mays]